MKRVLVTGASGFIGRHVLTPLQARGYEVHGLYRDESLGDERVTWHQADLADHASIKKVCKDVHATHLLHFAWYAVPGAYITSKENIPLIEQTISLLKVFRESGGERAVLAGSCMEYGETPLRMFSKETDELLPRTEYGRAKNQTKVLAEAYAKEIGLSLAWGRIFFLYGPHEARTRLVPFIINALLDSAPAETSSGEQIRDFLYVEDVADAFVALLESDVEGPVNIASGIPIPVKTVAQTIAEILGKPELLRLGAKPMRPDEPMRFAADISRLTQEVGWKAHYDLNSGLRKTVEWWKNERGRS